MSKEFCNPIEDECRPNIAVTEPNHREDENPDEVIAEKWKNIKRKFNF